MIEKMIEWFGENYEDPANDVPHDSREGGYQYGPGEPYDPIEVLQEEFDTVSEEDIEIAASKIYEEGSEWVKKDRYLEYSK